MASSLIGSLRVALGLDTAQFEAGANKSRSIARGLTKDIESSFKSAKIAVEGLVAAFAIGALTEQIKQSLQYAAAIGETASTLGVTTKQLQEFRFAASQVGVSQETLENGLKRLSITLGQLKVGAEAPKKALEALQKGLADQVRASPNTGDAFLKIADAMSKVTDRTQRAAVEVALFKKGGADLDSVLVGGSAKINALAEAAQQLGIVLSEDQIRNAEVTAHKLEALKTVLEANIASTVAANANSILGLAQALSTLTNTILHFFSSNPQLALALIGGLAGSRFGVAGAAIGAAGGSLIGNRVAQNAADQNMDLGFRIKAMRDAQAEFNARNSASRSPGSIIGFRRGSGQGGTVETAKREFERQIGLLKAATAAAAQSKPIPLGVNLPPFLAPKGPKAKKGPADRSEEVLAQMDKEILQASQNILQARQSLAGSSEQHLRIAVQLVQIERTIRETAIDEEIAKARRERTEGKITEAALEEAEHKAAILKAEAETEAQIKLQLIVERELTQHEHDLTALADQQLKFRLDALHTADQLATTQADHRRIQLAILDAEIEQQRLQLESNKRDAIRNGAKQEEIDLIQKSIDNLGNQRAQGAAVIRQNTLNPLEAWGKAIPQTATEITEAFQKIEVEGIDGLSSAIADVISGTRSLKDAFGSLAKSIISDIIQMTVKMLIFRALSSVFGGGGLGQSIYPVVNGVDPLAPRALGGPVSARTAYLVGERGPEIFMPKVSGSILPNNRLGVGENVNGRGGAPIVNQYFSPNFAGNAATHEDLVRMATMTKAATIEAIKDQRRRSA
jgi:hypothetical protein